MISLYRLFGGIAFVLMGVAYFWPLPAPAPIIIGMCLIVAGIALLAGM